MQTTIILILGLCLAIDLYLLLAYIVTRKTRTVETYFGLDDGRLGQAFQLMYNPIPNTVEVFVNGARIAPENTTIFDGGIVDVIYDITSTDQVVISYEYKFVRTFTGEINDDLGAVPSERLKDHLSIVASKKKLTIER